MYNLDSLSHKIQYQGIYAYVLAYMRECAYIRVYARIYAYMLAYTRICTPIRLANLLKQQRRCSVSAWDTVPLKRRRWFLTWVTLPPPPVYISHQPSGRQVVWSKDNRLGCQSPHPYIAHAFAYDVKFGSMASLNNLSFLFNFFIFKIGNNIPPNILNTSHARNNNSNFLFLWESIPDSKRGLSCLMLVPVV